MIRITQIICWSIGVVFALSAGAVQAQRSVASMCVESCTTNFPDTNSAAHQSCLAEHCAGLEHGAASNEEPTVRNISTPPASISGTGRWSVVGFEERDAVVTSAQGGVSLSYSCDGRGGFFVGLGGAGRNGRIIGMVFDTGTAHYPTLSQQPTGFQIQLWDEHPLIIELKRNNAVRLFERDGRVIGDFSLSGATRAINAARANCM